MDLQIECDSSTVTGTSKHRVIINAEGVAKAEILTQFPIEDILDHFSTEDLLDAMDLKAVKDHTGLVEPTDEM